MKIDLTLMWTISIERNTYYRFSSPIRWYVKESDDGLVLLDEPAYVDYIEAQFQHHFEEYKNA